MKKNQSAGGIAKPNDASGSDTITNLQDERLAPPGKWAASSLILRCPIPTQNPSLTGWGGGRWWCLCVGRVMFSLCLWCSLQSEWMSIIFWDIIFQKKARKMQAGAVARQAGRKWRLSAMQTLFIFNMSQVNIYIYISHTTSSRSRAFFSSKKQVYYWKTNCSRTTAFISRIKTFPYSLRFCFSTDLPPTYSFFLDWVFLLWVVVFW